MILSLSTKKVNLLSYKNERILPSVAIYGANAASKSNLHKAMSVAIRMIRSSNNLREVISIRIVLPPRANHNCLKLLIKILLINYF